MTGVGVVATGVFAAISIPSTKYLPRLLPALHFLCSRLHVQSTLKKPRQSNRAGHKSWLGRNKFVVTGFWCSLPSVRVCMSRIRSTFDSVSKAVGGSHIDILARSAGLKSNTLQVGKVANTKPECLEVNSVTSDPTAKPSQGFPSSYFKANMDDTYNSLTQQVNIYFGSSTSVEDRTSNLSRHPPHANENNSFVTIPSQSSSSPEAPSSVPTKKGIGHYLRPGPSVQAFVGNYIAPLVPRFCSNVKAVTAEKDGKPAKEEALSDVREAGLTTETSEQSSAGDKANQLLQQREKITARVNVDNHTRALVQALQRAADVKVYISRVEELNYHLLEFPETRGVAVKEKVIPCLLRLRQATDPSLKAAAREALALVGYTDPVKGRGIRVLSIDGGGTRGLVALQTLKKLEDLTGKPVYQLFDYICGVSTGAVLAFMLGMYQIPLDECEKMYRRLGSDIFKQNMLVGAVKMGWSHAYYDTESWEAILKERMGSQHMIEMARNPSCPKVAAVSTIVNRGTPLKAYVFRNYNLLPGVRSHYLGGCQHQLWQAIRASSAAPGYFQEFVLGDDLHQDGGLLINNPTALAIHECKCLWPNTPLQCVVSLGTGRYESITRNSTTYTSLRTKISNVISSATDTEEVHTMLDALLPPDTYFRFNPFIQEDVALDESRQEKLDQLQAEGARYLERNEAKLRRAASVLVQGKSGPQRLAEWIMLKGQMYDGLPFFSKL